MNYSCDKENWSAIETAAGCSMELVLGGYPENGDTLSPPESPPEGLLPPLRMSDCSPLFVKP